MPRKHRDLFDQIASFPALMLAAMLAAKGKRAKPGVAAFLVNWAVVSSGNPWHLRSWGLSVALMKVPPSTNLASVSRTESQ